MFHRGILASVTLSATLAFAGGAIAAADEEVPLYTNDDLERMFGAVPTPAYDLADRTQPEDWQWVESYLDRQYARLDADRQYELNRRTLDIAEDRTPAYGFRYPVAFGLGYPASTWWSVVQSRYWSRGYGGAHPVGPGRLMSRPMQHPGRGDGNGHRK
jgi:hypothetical protein